MQLPDFLRSVHRAAGVTSPDLLPIVFVGPQGERLAYQDAKVQMTTDNGLEMQIRLGGER
jgi:hypothetical protein